MATICNIKKIKCNKSTKKRIKLLKNRVFMRNDVAFRIVSALANATNYHLQNTTDKNTEKLFTFKKQSWELNGIDHQQ